MDIPRAGLGKYYGKKNSPRFKINERGKCKEKMQREKCPNCGQLAFYEKKLKYNLKYECKNCGYKMQVPLVEIWRDGPQDTIMDKINSKFIQGEKICLENQKKK